MEKKYTQGLIIDGITYNIPLISIKRNLDFLEKYAERSEDGDIKIETIGLYKNYTISIGLIEDAELYDQLIEHITDCENRFHHVTLPDASKQFDFYGYFSSIKDEVEKVLETGAQYKGLSWKMTSKKPYKTP
jgi:hypothetical protein|uniref:Uncharacterized protein n=1 Tax=Myoviridae sp. ctq9w2 TaxID=2825177 RepID=A0A8S5PWU0_9CAUD|nr:MAG TPA: hypothetical protein [Myoviridae sp. ctq9w2]DAM86687.1 MAG TPA: hypothetical protein [Caudoviricetes sp.]DAZ48112.1 MAG TPA: hypothetical protein [Caudoviricetes sp.]